MKIGLYLMGLKGLNSLTSIAKNADPGYIGSIKFVVSSKDANVQNDYFEEIRALAETHSIPFFEKGKFPLQAPVDYVFAISWRWMISDELEKLIVLHDSLLPKYRGFNPLVTALIEGDTEIGVTAIRAGRDFDKGNIISFRSTTIAYPVKINEAIETVSALYGELVTEVLGRLAAGSVQERIQDESIASYSLWRNEDDYKLNWNQDAGRIIRFIDALGYPYNGACTGYDGKKIIIDHAVEIEDLQIVNRDAGKILWIENNKPVIVCSKGLLRIEEAVYAGTREKVNFNKLRVRLNDSF